MDEVWSIIAMLDGIIALQISWFEPERMLLRCQASDDTICLLITSNISRSDTDGGSDRGDHSFLTFWQQTTSTTLAVKPGEFIVWP